MLAPGMLDGEFVDPKRKACAKWGSHHFYPDMDKCERAVDVVFDYVTRNLNQVKPCAVALTIEQAVKGDNSLCLRSLNRNTSPGFPWVLDNPARGKTHWLGEEENWIIHDDLVEAVEERIDLASRGVRSPTIWVDTLKDERISMKKRAIGKTRVFTNGPLDYLVATKMYFGGFFSFLIKNRITNGMALGVNPYGEEWDQMARAMQSRGSLTEGGDFADFDADQMYWVHKYMIYKINRWYTLNGAPDVDNVVRSVLFEELAAAIHLSGSLLYMALHGLCSGHFLTIMINNLYNMFLRVFSYGEIYPDRALESFFQHVILYVLGDDGVDAKDALTQLYTTPAMVEHMASLNMRYTADTKDDMDARGVTLETVTFLKRRFTYDEQHDRYSAPLDMGVVCEMTNWVRGGTDNVGSCIEVADASLAEAAIYPEPVFTDIQTKLFLAFNKLTDSRRPRFQSWGSYLTERQSDMRSVLHFYRDFPTYNIDHDK
jgi:hypothetical protein